MKRIKILYVGAPATLSFPSVGCNDSESDLLEPKLYFRSNVIRVEVKVDTYEYELVSRLSTMVKSSVNVNYRVGGQDLVDDCNHKHGMTGQPLTTDSHEMTGTSPTIRAGELYANPRGLLVRNVIKGEDGVTYILPVIVNSTDIEKISGSSVTYIIVRKPIIIDKVYCINPGWPDVRLPTAYETMGPVAHGALVYAERWKNLGTIMGNEGTLIMCTGDLNHPDNELQMAGSVVLQMLGVSIFLLNRWYHVAFTYDASTGMSTLYLNGEKIAEKTVGSLTSDLNERFRIGHAYDYDRYRERNGLMGEVRLQSVAHTANQIRENMVFVDSDSDGLIGYWKLNEEDIKQRDGVWYVLDQPPNHNNATSNNGLRGETGGSQSFVELTVVDTRVRSE